MRTIYRTSIGKLGQTKRLGEVKVRTTNQKVPRLVDLIDLHLPFIYRSSFLSRWHRIR